MCGLLCVGCTSLFTASTFAPDDLYRTDNREVVLTSIAAQAEAEARQAEFAAAFEANAKELLAAGIEVGYSKDVKTGFKLGEKSGGYYISFTDESFDALLKEYLREKVSNMLYK